MNYRKIDFKIEQDHGKNPSESSREARIRNYIFNARVLIINHTKVIKTRIRIIGYEVPIYARGKRRDDCMDLIGYDESFQPWIIELKIGKSTEILSDVVTQINRYVRAFEEGVREPIQNEIRERMLWPTFSFQGTVNKLILADRSFFLKLKEYPDNADDILFCSFSGYSDEKTLLKRPRAMVQLKIEKRLTIKST